MMRNTKASFGIVLSGLVLAALGWLARAAERSEAAATLSDADFGKLHTLIRPHADEARCRWMTDIPWETSIWEARQKAAAQGKPLLVVGSGGGSPLGRC
jgi:hypothetical protein